MSKKRYENAPIVEALIDIQVKMDNHFSRKLLENMAEGLSDSFPTQSPISFFQMGMQAPTEEKTALQFSSSALDIGILLTNKDNTRVLQIRENGFSYSHLPPFTCWDNLRSEALKLWNTFLHICKPDRVERFAVRVINRIEIPKAEIKLSDYVLLYPEIPPVMTPQMPNMFMQLQMPQPDLYSNAVVNFAMEKPPGLEKTILLLDFDIFHIQELSPDANVLWEYLDLFSERKDTFFESCITDETRSLFQ